MHAPHHGHIAALRQCEVGDETWVDFLGGLDTHFEDVGAFMARTSTVVMFRLQDMYGTPSEGAQALVPSKLLALGTCVRRCINAYL